MKSTFLVKMSSKKCMLPIILCLFEGLNDLRLVYNDCEKIYFITFVKVGVAIYSDHTVAEVANLVVYILNILHTI